jgi:hypothetical protein
VFVAMDVLRTTNEVNDESDMVTDLSTLDMYVVAAILKTKEAMFNLKEQQTR